MMAPASRMRRLATTSCPTSCRTQVGGWSLARAVSHRQRFGLRMPAALPCSPSLKPPAQSTWDAILNTFLTTLLFPMSLPQEPAT